MAFNLQNADHGDLKPVFERSKHDWLDYEAINAIFRSSEELTVSTQPVNPIDQGLYLYPMDATLDLIDWDYDVDTDVSEFLIGDSQIAYTVLRCDDFDTEDGVKITLERRVYETDGDGMFWLAHYRAFHNREDNSSDSGGDDGGIEAGEDDNATENAGDYLVDRTAHLAAAKAAWAMDLGRNPDTSDVAPVAAKAIFCEVEATYGSQVPGGTHRDAESTVYSSDTEEELMIRAAIEASKKDFQEGRHNTRYALDNDRSTVLSPRASINCEDKDISGGLLTSLEPRSSSMQDKRGGMKQKQPIDTSSQHGHDLQNINASYPEEPGSSSVQDTREDMKQKQPIGTSSLHRHDNQNAEASYPKEWGGIPSKELQEAIMLEKALFSGVAKESASHNIQPGNLIESQSPDKRTVGEEPERSSTTKKAALPIEPSVENEDAITPLVRMPDSSRHGRRFLKSDKLKNLFDFIDAAGLVKPGTSRVVAMVGADGVLCPSLSKKLSELYDGIASVAAKPKPQEPETNSEHVLEDLHSN